MGVRVSAGSPTVNYLLTFKLHNCDYVFSVPVSVKVVSVSRAAVVELRTFPSRYLPSQWHCVALAELRAFSRRCVAIGSGVHVV